MYNFHEGAAHVIAADMRSTFASMDTALATGARMLGNMVETAQMARLNATESQRIYAEMASGLANVVQGRADIVEAMKRLTVLKRNSNLETVDVGCDNPLPPKATEFFVSAKAVPA